MAESPWEFWIDVGGTFTDCLGRSPDGRTLQHKVLSTGVVKGQASAGSVADAVYDPRRAQDPAEFWTGATFTLFDESGHAVESTEVAGFDARSSTIRLCQPLGSLSPGMAYELRTGDEAPVLAIRYLLGLPARAPVPPVRLRLGTTRGTNALLTRTGARTALAITRGFGDLLEIGYQDRPRLFDLTVRKSPPLAGQTIEIGERVAADGTVLIEPDAGVVSAQLESLKTAGFESLAICLMHADLHPAHEELVEGLARDAGFAEISRSSAVAPLVKIVARADTTVVDAYLNPVLRQYLADLERSLPGSQIRLMTSAGGLKQATAFRGFESVLSGPAGGVVATARAAEFLGRQRAIGFDMGGTSTDVSRYDGSFDYEYESQKAGVRLVAPTLAIETVAAGGGSICAFDGVKLVVGPASAGADPGPACYGRGGPLCVTDLNLFLGRIAAQRFPFPPDRAAVERRLTSLSREVAAATGEALTNDQLASGLLRIANANMARAIRNVTVAKGFDPADYLLVAFGGAAPQHACAVARELGIKEILVHPDASLFSARGIGLANITRHAAEGVYRLAGELPPNALRDVFDRLLAKVAAELAHEAIGEGQQLELRYSLDVRYQGADATIAVPWQEAADWQAQFEQLHRQQYGYAHTGQKVEVAAARVEASTQQSHAVESPSAPGRRGDVSSPARNLPIGESTAFQFIGREALSAGSVINGPAAIAEPLTTTVVDSGWRAAVLDGGELLLTGGDKQPTNEAAPTAVMLEIFNNLLAGVAERMGHVLRRTAISVNVKERLDYSCAVFTAAGELVASAAHIPVHLGAMGATVRAVMADTPDLHAGDVVVTNDPYRGGSHLPDVTVVLPIYDDATGRLMFFTACRAHHAEIGGTRPGSMPPRSTRLGDEGVVISNFLLVRDRVSREQKLRKLLSTGPYPSRSVDVNLADLQAQLAAVHQGAADLMALVEQHSLDVVERQMQLILAASEKKLRQALAKLPAGERSLVDYLETADGARVPIAVRIAIADDPPGRADAPQTSGDRNPAAIFDFTGTGAVAAGNLNANPAIVSAAVLYVLRLLVDEDIPLNEGALRAVEIVLPTCLLNPPAAPSPEDSPAVAAGNVETSQRVVDVLLGALGLAAASQGTMNNVLFGADTFGYYETIGGGSGATAAGPGADAVQVHMTNTRATDPEVLERRLPVRLWQWSVRRHSGGLGRHRGGDGATRRLEFLAPLELSLITQRRGAHRPFGLQGGAPGASGENILRRADGAIEQLPGIAERGVFPGDMLELHTPGGGGFGT